MFGGLLGTVGFGVGKAVETKVISKSPNPKDPKEEAKTSAPTLSGAPDIIKIDSTGVSKQTNYLLERYSSTNDLFKLLKDSYLKLKASKNKEDEPKWIDKLLKNYSRIILNSNKLYEEVWDLNTIKEYFMTKFAKSKEEKLNLEAKARKAI